MMLGFSVLLGADVGSSVVAALVSSGSNIALWTAPIFMFLGYIIFQSSDELKPHNAGRVLIGLSLMLLSLRLISQATTPLGEVSLFHQVLTAIGQAPVLAFVIGAIMAWAFHSTLASILLIASLMFNGSLALPGALAFLLGINLGGGLPAFIASLGLPVEARRLPLGNLLARTILSALLLAFIPRIISLLPPDFSSPLQLALGFHVAFNLAVAIVFMPLAPMIEWLAKRLAPDVGGPEDPLRKPRYLDPLAIAKPQAALTNACIELARMGEVLERMFTTALKGMANQSLETLKQLEEQDKLLNSYHQAIQSYVNDVVQGKLEPAESRRALEITLYASNLEHAGDIIQLNLRDRIQAKIKEGHAFSADEQERLLALSRIIQGNIRLAASVTASRDLTAAQQLISQKDEFRSLENRTVEMHFTDALASKSTSLRQSALYVDLIRDLDRINAHIVAAGYPIVDEAGMLRASRLREAEIPEPAPIAVNQ
jgi:phosphate:Na+ symporter